jgi:hypothetical protein
VLIIITKIKKIQGDKKMVYSPIAIKFETKQKLNAIRKKEPKESWDELINRLLPKNETQTVEATAQ